MAAIRTTLIALFIAIALCVADNANLENEEEKIHPSNSTTGSDGSKIDQRSLFGSVTNAIGDGFKKIENAGKNLTKNAGKTVSSGLNKTKGDLKKLEGSSKKFLGNVGNSTKNGLKSATNGLKSVSDKVQGGLKSAKGGQKTEEKNSTTPLGKLVSQLESAEGFLKKLPSLSTLKNLPIIGNSLNSLKGLTGLSSGLLDFLPKLTKLLGVVDGATQSIQKNQFTSYLMDKLLPFLEKDVLPLAKKIGLPDQATELLKKLFKLPKLASGAVESFKKKQFGSYLTKTLLPFAESNFPPVAKMFGLPFFKKNILPYLPKTQQKLVNGTVESIRKDKFESYLLDPVFPYLAKKFGGPIFEEIVLPFLKKAVIPTIKKKLSLPKGPMGAILGVAIPGLIKSLSLVVGITLVIGAVAVSFIFKLIGIVLFIPRLLSKMSSSMSKSKKE